MILAALPSNEGEVVPNSDDVGDILDAKGLACEEPPLVVRDGHSPGRNLELHQVGRSRGRLLGIGELLECDNRRMIMKHLHKITFV